MWISSLKWGKKSKLTLVFSLLYSAAGWETLHRHTIYFNLLHVSSKAGMPGSSLSSLVFLMKLQVYCEYIPVLVSMCPEITVKQWEVSGLSDTTFKYWRLTDPNWSLMYLLSLRKLFPIRLADHFPALQMELHGIGSSPVISQTSFTLLQVTRQNFSLPELSGSLHPT